jgi:hypothetical protein
MNRVPRLANPPTTVLLLFTFAAASGVLGGCERKAAPAGGPINSPVSAVADSSSEKPREEANQTGRSAPLPADRPAQGPAAESASSATAPAQDAQSAATEPAEAAPTKVVAYYFHRTLRCPTCLSIEKQSQEAIELSYNGELSSGTLEWHAVNIEEPGNEHFEKDFALDRQALVLVELEGEEVQRHKKLERVWELVEDPYGFQEYVVTEVALFLGGG